MKSHQLFFALGQDAEARSLVRRFHYARTVPAGLEMVATLHEAGGLFGETGPAVAASFWCRPPTRWSQPILELSRLVRCDDATPTLSAFIAECCRWIRRKQLADLLVSFADPGHGHHGGIYQAASWNYGGRRESAMDGLIVDGQFWPGRSCYDRWGSRSPDKVSAVLGLKHSVKPHFDEGKHFYWRALTRKGEWQARTLGLERTAYPKPNK